jgi:uncharacterized protein with NAD-binding domain and iron-sulfur cluster
MTTAELQTHCRLREPRSQVVWLHFDRLLLYDTTTKIRVILRVSQHGIRATDMQTRWVDMQTRWVDQSASMTVTLTCLPGQVDWSEQ